jgi:predicted metalloprotease with PDZ domain
MSIGALRHLPWSLLLLILFTPGCAQEGQADTTTLKVAGSTIDVTLPGEAMKLSREELLGWVKGAANAVATYYGRFPVPHLTLKIRSSNGSGIGHGVTYARGGGLILISIGRDTGMAETKDDWVLVHEMIHLAFPSMPDDQHWIEEGISTYVEPVARVRVGLMSLDEMWRTFIRDMPKGEPASGDEGLDNTHTWGRTYWGGAMFCLLADVRIRERTGNRKGLQDALRGIVNGGNITEDWEISKALALGDKATGTTVLRDLYKEMRDKAAAVDLDQLWKKLGVAMKDGSVQFDDKAPEAGIRKAITAPSVSTSGGR